MVGDGGVLENVHSTMGMAVVAVEKIEAELTGNQVAAETKTPPWSVMVAVERIRARRSRMATTEEH